MNSGAKSSSRRSNGSMIALIVAFCFIIILLLFFALSYTRLLGTQSEQRTAIEAAAIAAARDCSRIVINTDEWGYVSLSDYAPTGTATKAADGYPLPVRSINTIIGTARLDLIIADKLGQPIMEDLAKKDMDNAKSVKDQLVAALSAAILPGGTGTDKDGNTITPYAAAEAAYQQNQVRMSGASTYVAGSMQLSLGSILNGNITRVPIPQPTAQAPVAASAKVGNFYKSYINIPYKGVDFVFGGIGDSIRIVDHNQWRATIPGLPYQIPTIIRAEANENISDVHSPSGYTIKAVACAQPATVHDPLPAPGALSISFPDGPVPEIKTPKDLYVAAKMNAGDSNITQLSAKVGDYPIDAGSSMAPMPWPIDGSVGPRKSSEVWRVGLFDWIRRAGTKANISSVINMQNVLLDDPSPATFTWIGPINYDPVYLPLGTIPSGIIHIFKFDPDGVATYESKPLTPLPLYASSHEQMHGEGLKGIHDSSLGKKKIKPSSGGELELTDDMDLFFRDEVRQPGPNLGGKHAGEPIAKPIVAMEKPLPGRMFSYKPMIYPPYPTVVGDGSPAPVPYPGPNNPPTPGPNKGYPPMVQARNDFGTVYNPAASVVSTMPGGSGPVRPFYETTGTAVDMRFRRVVDIRGMPGATSDYGYIYQVAPP